MKIDPLFYAAMVMTKEILTEMVEDRKKYIKELDKKIRAVKKKVALEQEKMSAITPAISGKSLRSRISATQYFSKRNK